jgi:hypothetical protein
VAEDGSALESGYTAESPSTGIDVCSVGQEVSHELHVENLAVASSLKRSSLMAVACGGVDLCTLCMERLDEAKVASARGSLDWRLAMGSNSSVVDPDTRLQNPIHDVVIPAILDELGQQRVGLAILVLPRRVYIGSCL